MATGGCVDGDTVPDRPFSYLAMRYEATIPQQKDFTCGAASMATLLTYYWGTPTSEGDALSTLRGRYADSQLGALTQQGLSFDDLIYMANQLGFEAQGARIEVDELAKLEAPVIVHLDKGSLKHFVVLRKVGDGVFYVSDPVVGQLTMDAGNFKQQYTGNVLTVWRRNAALPANARLAYPRDGIRLGDSLRRGINVPAPPFHPGL
jgi:predicted double-glycine peptidase